MTPFPALARALRADRDPTAIAAVVGVSLLMAAWVAWFTWGELPLYEMSSTARLETHDAAHGIDATVAGRLVRNELTLGRWFDKGDVVAEIDTTLERAALDEARARLVVLDPEIESLRREVKARELALTHERAAFGSAIREARTRETEADMSLKQASDDAARNAALHEVGAVAELELKRSQSQAQRTAVTRDALSQGTARLQDEQLERGSLGRVAIEQLNHDLVVLEGQRRVHEASITRLQQEIEQRLLRAPVSGRVGDAVTISNGAYVRAGDHLGSIVPDGHLRIVASFSPNSAGRIRPGQTARMRLEGFPWIQYGFVEATVTRVATETRDEQLRVELEPSAKQASSIEMQHGLLGSVEVRVERVSPAWLVFRSVGRYVVNAPHAKAKAQAAP